MRAMLAMLALALAWTTPALATGGFECTIEDSHVKFSAEGTFSHGVGEAIHTFRAELDMPSRQVPDHLRGFELAREHLTQNWLYVRDIKIRLFHEHPQPRSTVELIIETKQTPRDEMVYAGTYLLKVFYLASEKDTEGKSFTLRGKATCSAG